MYKTSKYTPTDKMSYLICDNYTLLQVMSRLIFRWGLETRLYRRCAVKMEWIVVLSLRW